MPLLFIHGVANRPGASYQAGLKVVETLLRRYAAPAISDDPAGVAFLPVLWGDLGAAPAWGGASRPRSSLLGMGAGPDAGPLDPMLTLLDHPGIGRFAPSAAASAAGGLIAAGGLSAAGAGPGGEPPSAASRLRDLPPADLADLLAACLAAPVAGAAGPRTATDDDTFALALIAADDVANDPGLRPVLAAAPDGGAERAIVQARFDQRLAELLAERGGLVGMGAGEWAGRLRDRLTEVAGRGVGAPAWAASRVLLEARGPVNDLATTFIGDVLTYLTRRGPANAPGPIPRRLIDALAQAAAIGRERGGEPVVLLSHSMGGQISYDTLAGYLPALPDLDGVRVDFWCAAASQVGLFEELKLFLASSPEYSAATGVKVPRPGPTRLGGWWNAWDPNDVLSYTAAPIFDGVDDEAFDGGLSLAGAHHGYLIRPSFYRRLRAKLEAAAAASWGRP